LRHKTARLGRVDVLHRHHLQGRGLPVLADRAAMSSRYLRGPGPLSKRDLEIADVVGDRHKDIGPGRSQDPASLTFPYYSSLRARLRQVCHTMVAARVADRYTPSLPSRGRRPAARTGGCGGSPTARVAALRRFYAAFRHDAYRGVVRRQLSKSLRTEYIDSWNPLPAASRKSASSSPLRDFVNTPLARSLQYVLQAQLAPHENRDPVQALVVGINGLEVCRRTGPIRSSRSLFFGWVSAIVVPSSTTVRESLRIASGRYTASPCVAPI
jgi:hypothetical protein